MNRKLEKVIRLLDGHRQLLHEYYERVDDKNKDRSILGNIRIDVYKLDREAMTPHIHIKYGKEIEIEVSLIDWSILNVKKPKELKCDWSLFTIIRDKFFKWIDLASDNGEKNYIKIFKVWNENNPDNQLDNTWLDGKYISPQLDNFLEPYKKIDFNEIKKDIYKILIPLVSNGDSDIFKKDIITILKEIGIYEKYPFHLDDVFEVAERMIEEIKGWYMPN